MTVPMPPVILSQAVLFIVFVCLGVILPGALLTVLFAGKDDGLREGGLPALVFLAGFIFCFPLWAGCRLGGLSYGWTAVVHFSIVALLAFFSFKDRSARDRLLSLPRLFFSAENAVSLALVSGFVAWFTYDSLIFYHGDELLRLSFAGAAQRGLPAQNLLAHSGILRYYYATEFFAGTASAVLGIPLETVYFRLMLGLNWLLLLVGMKGLASQYKPGSCRYAPHFAFLLFMLLQPRLLPHFAFRQHTFGLGLFTLSVSALWTAFSSGKLFPLALCALSAALMTSAKAPFGALYLVFIGSALAAGFKRGLIRGSRAVIFAALTFFFYLIVYKALTGAFHGAGAIISFGIGEEWYKEFLASYIYAPGTAAYMCARLGTAAPVFLNLLENLIMISAAGLLPCISALAVMRGLAVKRGGLEPSADTAYAVLTGGAAVFVAGMLLYLFVHFTVCGGSDSYWLLFPVLILGSVAYPLMLCGIAEEASPRRLGLLALVPCAELLVSLSVKVGGPQGFAAVFGSGALDLALFAASAALLFLSARWFRSAEAAASGSASRAREWGVFLAGLSLFILVSYKFELGRYKDLLFFASWIPAAALFPLLLREFEPSGALKAFAVIPFIVGLSHAPKSLYWAEQTRNYSSGGRSAETLAACSVLNAGPGADKLYLHNVLDTDVFYLAGACRRRMYVSQRTNPMWEDETVYVKAREEAEKFFDGRMAQPCCWLKARNIGYIYLDAAAGSSKFLKLLPGRNWLKPVYSGKQISLYEVGSCEGEARGHQPAPAALRRRTR